MNAILQQLRFTLIASCQALPGEPLHGSEIMARMALAAQEGGASAIRANSAADVQAIKKAVSLPVIGLVKRDYPDSDVYITPTLREIDELAEAGADLIALDATRRPRPGGVTLERMVSYIQERGLLSMADISTLEEAVYAGTLGVSCVSTTLSGYTPYSPQLEGPDLTLVQAAAAALPVPVIAEGRIQEPGQVQAALQAGAHAVVVGSAISRPQLITRRFAEAARKAVMLIHGNERPY
ncbi:N-acetylmannosamine-6-phosphate 2-epimerase [Paenibacillus sp. JX-17]|uniref:Putative N-acetylmannosamine-6-phosphate 2-epimerase n=1 Tax=Paenibacillus lacisoli TaxID=3064525 RepID=A0ABT9CC52_9BACL|nr:N-acetylmannosamine-6-phosphate 2-epimerase [Paenibacillus sp. JX-17]MDO7906846.1 N-acetylmannosamine-6-phosphate 2-epimerase [Paenibacillus sp. JX-17]